MAVNLRSGDLEAWRALRRQWDETPELYTEPGAFGYVPLPRHVFRLHFGCPGKLQELWPLESTEIRPKRCTVMLHIVVGDHAFISCSECSLCWKLSHNASIKDVPVDMPPRMVKDLPDVEHPDIMTS